LIGAELGPPSVRELRKVLSSKSNEVALNDSTSRLLWELASYFSEGSAFCSCWTNLTRR